MYQNYHSHNFYSNVITPDSVVSPEDYAKRSIEIGGGIISSVAHGWQGRVIEYYELAKQYNLKYLFGVEAYWVKDRLEKDRTNAHIILLAKNENGRKSINRILSEANLTGFYYKQRVDIGLILSLPKDDVWITSACIAGWKYDDANNIWLQIHDHFENNFFLEVQYHNVQSQKNLNARILNLAVKNNIQIIMGCDSHYIYPEQAKNRDNFLLSKKIKYEDEEGWLLDYCGYDTCVTRFQQQGILSDTEITTAINNTNIFLDVEEYTSDIFTKNIKLPTLYPSLSKLQKEDVLIKLIWDNWEIEKSNVPEEQWEQYKKEIKKELDTIIATNMCDYFLLNYEIIKKGKENGGHITMTGRGCFTEDALVHTSDGIKTIDNIKKNDLIINEKGEFIPVFDTMSYDINEEMIQVEHIYGTNKYYPYICTTDHKILINHNNHNLWMEAKNITNKDYVCVPKINFFAKYPSVIDLNEYNQFGFDFDENYIYEKLTMGKAYPYSPSEMARKYHVGKSIFENFSNGKEKCFTRKKDVLHRFFIDTPFSSQQEYMKYIQSNKILKIKRFLSIDEIFNQFIGIMYGDGFTVKKNSCQLGLAINTKNHKNIINRNIFMTIANRIGCGIYENKSKIKNLSQLYMSSFCFRNFFEANIFISKNGSDKLFNKYLFYQNADNRIALKNGLMLSDGSRNNNDLIRDSFDNTSLSLINAFKILGMSTNESPMSICVRPKHSDSRGYNCKTSYKLRINHKAKDNPKTKEQCWEDNDYWYLPIKKTSLLQKQKIKVYDISTLGTHSYLINNMIVHNSAPSYYVCKLLGFTTIDRISAPIKLFPERFITKERILEAGSLPDIDFNLANPEVFLKAQQEVLGEDHSYPMIAYGTLSKKSCWKMYARAMDIDFDIANEISKAIDKYEMKLKYSEDEDVNIDQFIPDKYLQHYKDSEKYLGIVDNYKIHPCGSILYDKNIKEEIGLVRTKEHICACIDGLWAEEYHFIKNDLLKVSVVDLIYKVYERIGIEPHLLPKLIELCENNNKVWETYKNAWVIGINQLEQKSTSGRVATYAPKNISELAAFISSVRPGFQSNYKQFESREPFEYGVQSLDNLIQTKEFPFSFMLYQETSMQILSYAGIPISETYDILKNIAKKRAEKVFKYKEQFLQGMTSELILRESTSLDESKRIAGLTWQIIEDSSRYQFNASHAYSMAGDALYGAYLKSHYPLEFYEVFLNLMEQDGDKDRLNAAKEEAENAYKIKFPHMRFGQDNRKIVAIPKENKITSSLTSIKGFGKDMGNNMFDLAQIQHNNFVDLLVYTIDSNIFSSKFENLIKINYFEQFGNNKKLLTFFKEFTRGKYRYNKKLKDKTKQLRLVELHNIFNNIENKRLNFNSQLDAEKEILGYLQSTYPVDKRFVYIFSVDTRFSPRVETYCLNNGARASLKVQKKLYDNKVFYGGEILKIKSFKKKETVDFKDGEFIKRNDNTYDWWIEDYDIIPQENFDEMVSTMEVS